MLGREPQMKGMMVLVLRDFRGRIHSKWHTLSNPSCPGIAAHAEQHPETDYVKVPISSVPASVPACRFCGGCRPPHTRIGDTTGELPTSSEPKLQLPSDDEYIARYLGTADAVAADGARS